MKGLIGHTIDLNLSSCLYKIKVIHHPEKGVFFTVVIWTFAVLFLAFLYLSYQMEKEPTFDVMSSHFFNGSWAAFLSLRLLSSSVWVRLYVYVLFSLISRSLLCSESHKHSPKLLLKNIPAFLSQNEAYRAYSSVNPI